MWSLVGVVYVVVGVVASLTLVGVMVWMRGQR